MWSDSWRVEVQRGRNAWGRRRASSRRFQAVGLLPSGTFLWCTCFVRPDRCLGLGVRGHMRSEALAMMTRVMRDSAMMTVAADAAFTASTQTTISS